MWRQNVFPATDLHESISDDEEFDPITYDNSCLERLVSLYERGKKEEPPAASQLEILKDSDGKQLPSTGPCELNHGGCKRSRSFEKLESFSSEDEIEMHDFQNKGDFMQSHSRKVLCCGSDGQPHGDEGTENMSLPKSPLLPSDSKFEKGHQQSYASESQNGDSMWSAVLKETKELVCLHENVASSSSYAPNSEAKKFWTDSGQKAKPKFSFRSNSCKEASSWHSLSKDVNKKSSPFPVGFQASELRSKVQSIAELLEGIQEGNGQVSEASQLHAELVGLGHESTTNSMSELLEGLKEKNCPSQEPSNMKNITKERRFQHAGKRTLSALGTRALDNEDPVEPVDCGTSSEDEGNPNQSNFATPKTKGQTMADRFQEVFSAAAVYDEGALFPINKHLGIGYYGRLQQIMQNEKDRHMEFLKQLRTGGSQHDEDRCIQVQIVSRYLEAKLTVCHCSFLENSKSSHYGKDPEKLVDGGGSRNLTIIFSPRICGNVELEVGALIRIHPPWKEVTVMEDEKIILCTYFSQI